MIGDAEFSGVIFYVMAVALPIPEFTHDLTF